ncbi:PQQ-like beta-propeller repeat protein [Halorussus gelatinilyticus]|uniref:PQQ-like beta-propeller repeat protein n=1 Tax=Halorussus gelatinilyticus TaxID=2937524 RepID=A0A8U0IIG9_9EURY|nr:PQQ-binding-like beta-propeller repeat protein [Halorussus gelatinilyticus]UPW00074.1 PQQ-like beta-propeller repeat protein [Halorussus gelatinilyticus]
MSERGPRTSRRQFLAVCGATPLGGCGAALGIGGDGATAWATVQRDPGHTGYLPDGTLSDVGLVSGWDLETDIDGLFRRRPVFADGTLFVPSETELYAIDAEEGSVVWTRSRTTTNADGEEVPFRVGRVVTDGDCAFVAWDRDDANDVLAAYPADGGEARWEFETNTNLGAVLPVEDRLYVVATLPEGQRLVALDAATGRTRWRRPVALAGNPPLAYADGTLFSGRYRDEQESFTGTWFLQAFDADGGERRWKRGVTGYGVGTGGRLARFFGLGGGEPNLTAADGRVYFGTGPHELYALDAADGTVRWSHSLEGGNTDTGHAPVVDDDTVYLANLSTAVALDAATGAERWRYDEARIPFEDPQRYPILVGDTLVVPEQVTLLALDAVTGEERFRLGPYDDGLVGVAPLAVDGRLYTPVGDSVYAIGRS